MLQEAMAPAGPGVERTPKNPRVNEGDNNEPGTGFAQVEDDDAGVATTPRRFSPPRPKRRLQ
eukprot:12896178-Prorocentrum_lima.AAC.1